MQQGCFWKAPQNLFGILRNGRQNSLGWVIARFAKACAKSSYKADSARGDWTIYGAGCAGRSAAGGAAHGRGVDGVCGEPRDGMPAAQLERFARIASHDDEWARVRLYGLRAG